VEDVLQRIFAFRKDECISSRVRFKVQDLIDEYEREWKCVIFGERNMVDSEGF
jgi:hypothetical protein